MGRRIIVCDGAESARLWSRIGTEESEILTWVPRDEEDGRARPPGFKQLQGGLSEEAFTKLGLEDGDDYALASDDGPWLRSAVREIAKASPEAPILVLSDGTSDDDLPDHPCLRQCGLKTLIRDDIDDQFDHLANLRRVVELRRLLDSREKVGILLQPDPDPDGIASGYALRSLLGRKRTTAPLISFGEVQRPENRALADALGIEIRVITPEELEEMDGLVLVDVQPNVFGENAPERVKQIDAVIDHHPERTGYEATIKDIRTSYGATATICFTRAGAFSPKTFGCTSTSTRPSTSSSSSGVITRISMPSASTSARFSGRCTSPNEISGAVVRLRPSSERSA